MRRGAAVLTAGASVGPYQVVSQLGAGAMGEVWRARDSRLDREVALKVIAQEFVADDQRHARFEREAKLLAALNHPHIATVYGLEHVEGNHVLVMELVEGEGLDQRLARGLLPAPEAVRIALEIAEALEAAHEAGIVHRDLKPANIRIRPDGTVKVLDLAWPRRAERPQGRAARRCRRRLPRAIPWPERSSAPPPTCPRSRHAVKRWIGEPTFGPSEWWCGRS